MEQHKSGFAAVVGRPNVGKSTLINALIGQKIAIMSDKPQTTRSRILCVLTRPDAQIIFLDTPGVHKPMHRLGEYMSRSVMRTIQETDAILFVVDATEKTGSGENFIIEKLRDTKKPVVLVINKIDKINRENVLPVIDIYRKKYDFAGVVPVSAKNEENLGNLVEEIKKHIPKGMAYYPPDMVTDQPERLIAAELIREKALELTRDEVPHSVAVEIDEMAKRARGGFFVRATIYVERDSQKGIVIGKDGAMLREIGKLARADIETMLGRKIFLDLWVKVSKDWRNRDAFLKNLGFGKD